MNMFGQQPTNPMNNFFSFLQRFKQFRDGFKGDPKQQVEQMLASGKITKQQYDNAVNQARQIMELFGQR